MIEPWTVFIPFLFQIAVALIIGVSWALFIRNIVRNSQKNRNRNRKKTAVPPSAFPARTNTNRRSVIDQYAKRDTAGQPARRRNSQSSGRQKEDSLFQRLRHQSPRELYAFLEKHLPVQYHAELRRIFNSPHWKKELWRFLRREDLWPFLQDLARSPEETMTKGRSRSAPAPTAELQREEADTEDVASLMRKETAEMEAEYADLIRSYDDLAESLNAEDAVYSAGIPGAYNRSRKRSPKQQKHKKANKKWLQDAVLAKEILERPDF